ncbi:hypothetical protein TPHA_0B04250 [Tetrapisispora phaffii CBS 4417]|uniref:Nucleoporin Nup159/Nup146 N-terminal domain-containing protein n=1 Tax=Tetrapisispora phaffii (strain ATCC 24235 / CBS 4417 / NBRC 1672 / NRRL Y-8282 / UCD 70-5) TaxID=1071381 RepID=G8BQ13_TETPH|nr:hypothetical protein TPHA_0B04250 [Tetrapisispora phaffii CBS 4417]CCE62094.1 hypothetical protein TPHA_0B04250 [Tetrapisispora phaffii CBS 4417]
MSLSKPPVRGERNTSVKKPVVPDTTNNELATSIYKQATMDKKLSEKLTRTITDELLNKKNVEHITDDRRLLILSRAKSRFVVGISPNEVYAIEFQPTGKALAYSRYDGSLTVWFLVHDTFNRSFKAYKKDAMGVEKPITSISWNSNEVGQFATVSNSNYIQIWNVDHNTHSLTKYRTLNLDSSDAKLRFTKCHYDPSSQWLAAVTKNNEICLFDVKANHKQVHFYNFNEEVEGSITFICWNNHGNYIIVGTSIGEISLLRVNNNKELKNIIKVPAHRGKITGLKVTPLGDKLVSVGEDGACLIWDLESLTCISTIVECESNIRTFDLSPSGKLLVVVSEEGKFRFYDMITTEKINDYDQKHLDSDFIVKFYPNKSWLMISGENDTLCRLYSEKGHSDELSFWKSFHPEVFPENEKARTYNDLNAKKSKHDWNSEQALLRGSNRDSNRDSSRAPNRGASRESSRGPDRESNRGLNRNINRGIGRDSSRGPNRNKRPRANPRPARFSHN